MAGSQTQQTAAQTQNQTGQPRPNAKETVQRCSNTTALRNDCTKERFHPPEKREDKAVRIPHAEQFGFPGADVVTMKKLADSLWNEGGVECSSWGWQGHQERFRLKTGVSVGRG